MLIYLHLQKMANYKHDNTFIFKNKNINVSVHPFIEEH